ncbi:MULTISPECIES: DUF481 domain-containing protein [Pantoea]|uniref:DUF481 domain-containing protein n=1 Tax=Pantoea brenneri TaxID=472694 RepID=A0A653W776_9GAMM|nr:MULTISPECIES: DUF481 domain-containing protein [Pantoea]KKD34054.1 hypothetical protein EP46_09320 [Pantoea sp. 3.5.1]MBS6032536.1 DUF481 domain-containing protein [Pantoea sp.]MBZ6393818.1 DUF481 domain-containing protein [Pantoea sp.]MBZ6436804.1 DUF481 domain-containing protein [Pantoea sp.]MCQ5472392.1 DUF481 domain-containing protein [Pantoea brenneri]
MHRTIGPIRHLISPLLTVGLALGWADQAAADTVWLNNGDRLTGTVRYLSDGKLAIETAYAGTVTLDWNVVSTLASENPVNVENKKTGERYQVRLSASDPGYIWVERNEREEKISVKRIDEFMKAKVRTDQLSWTGNIDAGMKVKKASTKTDDYNFSLNTKLAQGKWRHDIGATYNREQENEDVNTDNYSLRYAFDYLFREQFFWQTRATYKRDWVEDLSRQALIGTGPGYQLWDTELSSFSVSILGGAFGYGYSDGREEKHFGASVRWSYQRYLLGKSVTLYSNGDVGHSLDDDGVFTLDAEVGLRYTLTSWSTLHLGYHRNLVNGTPDTLNEGTFSTGLGVKW